MITRNSCLALICFFISVKLTSSTEFYLLKVLKAPTAYAKNENAKENLYLKVLPLGKSNKKGDQTAKTDAKYDYPCTPGQNCMGKVQHNQNSVVINNGLRNPTLHPSYNFFQYLNLDDTTDTDEYIDIHDNCAPFYDQTRFLKTNKQRGDIKRKHTKESFSNGYLDINDLRRSKNNNVNRQYRKVLLETQGKQYMRVYSSDDSESSEETYEETSVETVEKETTEVNYSKKRIPKRFEVVHNSKKKKRHGSRPEPKSESDDLENFEPITTPRPKKKPVHKKKNVDNFEDEVEVTNEVYIQRPGKYVKLGSSSEESYRRRLEHFLPKRYHWNEDDFSKLGYYWFNGPQGKYPGNYKIGY